MDNEIIKEVLAALQQQAIDAHGKIYIFKSADAANAGREVQRIVTILDQTMERL